MARGGGGGAVSLLENSRLGKKMFRNEIPEHGRRSNYRLFRCIRDSGDVKGREGKDGRGLLREYRDRYHRRKKKERKKEGRRTEFPRKRREHWVTR